MANQLENLKDAIKAAIATCQTKVQTYYPTVTDWATNHIFYGSNPLIHGQNRGRKIICHFWREATDYQMISDGNSGTLLTTWVIEVSAFKKPAGVSKIRNEEGYEDALDDIFNSIISAIRSQNGLNLSNSNDAKIERINLMPHGFTYRVRIDINNSWTNPRG